MANIYKLFEYTISVPLNGNIADRAPNTTGNVGKDIQINRNGKKI